MKPYIKWTLLLVVVVFGLSSFYMRKIEKPAYTVEKELSRNMEIRLYQNMVVAKTKLPGASFDDYGSQGFRNIASYIFGNNANNQKIAMTSPVIMEQGEEACMYFVMPKEYDKKELPKPNSSRVEITEMNPKKLAVVRFGGWANDDKIAKHRESLKQTLQQQGIKTVGPYLYMGYNAPWDILFRRNEVAVEVE